jgi:hypothetical protein
MNFVRSCQSHDSCLIKNVANYAVMHAHSHTFLTRNVLFCARRHKFSDNSTIYNKLGSLDTLITTFVRNSIDDQMSCFANFLYELIMLREGRLCLNDGLFSTEDVNDITYYICTS